MISRAYKDEDEGKIVREGFEPSKFNPVSSSDFAVGDDDDEPQNVGQMQEGWDRGDVDDSVKPPRADSPQYATLDDRNVWNTGNEEEHL